MPTGQVKWFDPKKGFGFISQEDGEDVFVHWRDIVGEDDFKTLEDGEQVSFEIAQGEKGLRAEKVTRVQS